jgi:hypothetical protein
MACPLVNLVHSYDPVQHRSLGRSTLMGDLIHCWRWDTQQIMRGASRCLTCTMLAALIR